MFTDEDRGQLRGRDAAVAVELQLQPFADESSFGRRLRELVQTVGDEAEGAIRVVEVAEVAQAVGPSVSLARGGRANICFAVLPEGHEAAPFADCLRVAAGLTSTPSWAGALDALEEPAELLVFVSPMCPHCPRTVHVALSAALAQPQISVTVIDAEQFPDLASQYGARSVPLTVIDDGLALVGEVTGELLSEKLLSRGSDSYSAERIRSMAEGGRFAAVATAVRHADGARGFFGAWRQSTTSTRMGLLLASETALEESRACLDPLVDDLCGLLKSEDAALRGDTADLLGRIGHAGARGPLRSLLRDANPDVAEIAGEAIDEIAGREEEG